jgi:hypothetical protein
MTRQKSATKKVIQAQIVARQDAVSGCLASAVRRLLSILATHY